MTVPEQPPPIHRLDRSAVLQATLQAGLIGLPALLIGLLALRQPLLAGAASAAALFAALLFQMGARLPAYALGLLGVSLAGYAFLGKGYAYLGVPPLFIGEVALGLGLIGLVMAWARGARLVHTRGLVLLIALFILIGLGSTLPYVGKYGLNAIRDAAAWYYALFTLIVATLVVHLGRFRQVILRYGRVLPYFLLAAPFGFWITRLFEPSIPTWPISAQAILLVKGGDLAVHLAGVMAFLMLGLHRLAAPEHAQSARPLRRRTEWWWWGLWMISFASLLTGRASLVTVGAALACVLLLRPISRWGRPLFLAASMLLLLVVVDPRIKMSSGRELSLDGLLLNVQSITGDTGVSVVDGTRTWRLDWWRTITRYTVYGDKFWTGKGYGINLANSDGFQVDSEQTLRNPHSIHYSILARSGVPGLVSWIALNLVFAWSLLMAFFRARTAGHLVWANVHLWILAYWVALMTNASFDVFIEGPQGGIWYWSLLGFGIAALELYRRGEKV
ncbi:O-antigen ligase family protein [Deinococcus koreensis]|nr:O-antigen ligase family protein [Deinococcus koreensis]